ncbi:MAG: 30S ribosomal protein S12 methylthiotransferase RimO [bacterium]
MTTTTGNPARSTPKFVTVTLGCEKNLVDSEELIGVLEANGWKETRRLADARAILVNTCAFIEPARQESLAAIRRITAIKEERPEIEIIVFGCLAKKSVPMLKERFNGALDGVFESHHEVIAHLLDPDVGRGFSRAALPGTVPVPSEQWRGTGPRPTEARHTKTVDWNEFITLSRKPLTPPWYAYLKISEGCSRRCSFCIIPRLRGTHNSKPFDLIKEETELLVRRGVTEINVIAQDSTLYGRDLKGAPAHLPYAPSSAGREDHSIHLPDVLKYLSSLDELQWIRVFYLYPHGVTDEILDAFHLPKVLPYFDVPVQHASQRMLDLMARDGSVEDYERILNRIHGEFENPYLRTSIIVGFPGETEEDFETALAFLRKWRFNGVSAFAYSREDLSKSYQLPDQLPEEVKQERLTELMRAQAELQFERNRLYVGTTADAVVEKAARNGYGAQARAWFQAPDVDGIFEVQLSGPHKPGEHIRAAIHDVVETDFVGAEVDG